MGKTLLDIPIDEAELPQVILTKLKDKQIYSIGQIFQTERKDFFEWNFNSYEVDLIRKHARKVGESKGFSWHDKEKELGKILTLGIASKKLGFVRGEDLWRYVKKGVFDQFGFVLYIGIDILPKIGNESLPVFTEKGIVEFRNNYKPLSAIAKESKIQLRSLLRYNAHGKLDQARLDPDLKRWNVRWIKENYTALREEGIKRRRDKTSGKKRDYFSMLNNEQQKLISLYCDHRKKFGISYGGAKFKKFALTDSWIEHQNEIARLFYLVICEKSGIEKPWELDAKKYYRELSHAEKEKFDPDNFNVFSFSALDFQIMLTNKQSDHSRYSVKKYLKPFFWFLFMKKKENIQAQEITGELLFTERAKLDYWAEALNEAFEQYSPSPMRKRKYRKGKKRSHNSEQKEIISIFLDRIDVVRLVKRVFLDTNMRDPLKNAAMLIMGFLSVIRPIEMKRMRIERHLDIDPKTGLLNIYRINNVGFGRAIITDDISKKGISPSGDYDILLVPQVVKYLNLYLQQLYKKYPLTKGKGFLFRPSDLEHDPNREFSGSDTMYKWLRDHKKNFVGILSDFELEHFSSYDPRHTGNNLIAKKTFFFDRTVESLKQEVAKYHCRHWGDSDMNEEHYQEKFTEEIYAHIINTALGFPFDENELLEWEEQMLSGQRNNRQSNQVINSVSDSHDRIKEPSTEALEKKRITDQEIKQLEKEINELGKKSNEKFYEKQGLNFDKRLEKVRELQTKINELTSQIDLL